MMYIQVHSKNGDSWDRFFHQGVRLLQRFAQDNRVQIPNPHKNLQVKILRPLGGGHQFVCYLDAIGTLDGVPCVLDWKTTTGRYPTESAGLLSLDLQLISYSWANGLSQVALVVFVRKNLPEIQYLRATISEERRQEFGRLIEATVGQIEAGHFASHSGIRYPQTPCLGCSHLGLCLNDRTLIEQQLIRTPGASDLDWLDQFVD